MNSNNATTPYFVRVCTSCFYRTVVWRGWGRASWQ